MRSQLTANNDSVTDGAITLINNTWNVAPLINGTDFVQSVGYNPADLIHGTRFQWSYGPDDSRILAYPSVMLGYSPWGIGTSTALETRISALRDMTLTYDVAISGQTEHFNAAYDLWLIDAPQATPANITTEVMIWVHSGSFPLPAIADATWDGAGFNANVYVKDGFSAAPGVEWRYVAVVLTQTRLAGQIDLDGLLRFLTARGIVDSADYLTGVEFGCEVSRGRGSLMLNEFGYALSRYAITDGADHLRGTRQDDVIAAMGGRDTLWGGAGDDVLDGGRGADRLHGGAGADRLHGGGGADRFVFTTRDHDRITDFNAAEGDRIDLTALTLRAADLTLETGPHGMILNGPGGLSLALPGVTDLLVSDLML